MRFLPQTPIDWILLLAASATGLIVFITLQDFFLDSRLANPKLRALQDLGIAFAVAHFGVILLRGAVGPGWAIAGILLYVAAMALVLGSIESAKRVRLPRAFVEDPQPKALVTTGPFAVIRHPIYVAYSLAWLAAPIATWGPIVGLFAAIEIGLYLVAARREEAQLELQFGDAYRVYCQRTGMFFPSPRLLFHGRSR